MTSPLIAFSQADPLPGIAPGLQWDANDAQFLLRALLFRAITDLLHRPHEEPDIVTRPYQPALELALRLAET